MGLEAHAPLGVLENVVEDELLAGGGIGFGLEVAIDCKIGQIRLHFGPGEVGLAGNHDFEFLDLGVNLWKWGFEDFWGEGDPVEAAAEGVGAGGFEVGAESGGLEGGGEVSEVVHERFAACNHYESGVAGGGCGDEIGDRALGMMFLAPTDFRIAPGTAHITARQPDEKSVSAGPCAFALDRVEGFDDGQRLREGLGEASHRSIRPRR